MKKAKHGYKLLIWNTWILIIFYLLSDYIFRKFPDITVAQTMFWGYLGALILITPFFIFNKKYSKSVKKEFKLHKKLIIGVAILTALASALFIYGIQNIGSGPVVLLENSQVIFAFILGILFLKERFVFREIIWSVVMVVGLLLISSLKGEVILLPAIMVVFSAFLWALQSLLIGRFGENIDTIAFTYLRGWIVWVLIVLFTVVISDIEFIPWIAFILFSICYFFGMFLSRVFFFEAHKYLSVSKINIFLLIQPVGVIIGTVVLFQDSMSIQKIAGGLLILLGAYFFTNERKKVKREK